MTIHTAFMRDLTMATMNGLMHYYQTIEAQLQVVRTQEKQKTQEFLRGLNLDYEDYLSEFDVQMQEYTATFEMLFTNFFRFSCITLLYLVTEDKLRELSEAAQVVRKVSTPVPQPTSNTVNEYKKYLTDEIRITGINWGKVDELNKVRNCIVHKSGKVKGFRSEIFLRSLAKSAPGFHISGKDYSYPEDVEPLYLEDDMIVLDKSYCQQAIKEISELFEQICDAIPLHSFIARVNTQ